MEEKIERLSEGYDFIEENTPFCNEALKFESTEELAISESEEAHSPYKILGKVRGVMAPIGEFSRNGRLYENSHWNKVLSNQQLQEKIANRRCFGTLSHADKKVDDSDFREGKISHICSVLEVRNDDNGKPFLYGELDILDTPAGRILEAMYRGGAGLYVSSRGAGKLLPVPGQTYKMVDSSNYYFESIDFVLNPGFLQAKPVFEEVKEEIKESQETTSEAVPIVTEAVNPTSVVTTNEEVEELKEQIDKLAKIIEKVVDDVYEVEEPVEESSEAKGALIGTLALLANSNISEGLFEQIVEIIKKSKENK